MNRHLDFPKRDSVSLLSALALLVAVPVAGCHSSVQLRHEIARGVDSPAYASQGIDQVLSSHNSAASRSDTGPPDDGLNGEYAYSAEQPVWDVVAYDRLPGPQLADKRDTWPSPGPAPVFDTVPAIDVSWLNKRAEEQPAAAFD